jgi:tetratricopeptide (TPR) repeat protein
MKKIIIAIGLCFALVPLTAQTLKERSNKALSDGNAKYLKKDFNGALADYNMSIAFSPSSQGFYNRGLCENELLKYSEAVSDFTRSIERDPKNLDAFIYRGVANLSQKNSVEAMADFNKVITLDPKNATAYYYRGFIKYSNRNFQAAISDFTKILAIQPNYQEAYFYRASAKYELKDYTGAIADFDRLLTINPDFIDGYVYKTSAESMQKEYDKALRTVNAGIALHPKESSLYTARANVYYNAAKFDLAVDDFIKALELNKSASNYVNLCETLARLHQFNEAADYYKRSLREGFDYTKEAGLSWQFFARYVEAVTYGIAANDYPKALAMLNESAELYTKQGDRDDSYKNSTLVSVYAAMGYVLEKLNRNEEAIDIYKKALIIGPNQTDIILAVATLQKRMSDIAKTDKIPPVIEIISPKPTRSFDIEADNGKTEIIGKAKDNSGIESIKINGVPVDKVEDDGIFVTEWTLKEGANEITVVARDKQGNEASKTVVLNGKAVAKGQTNQPASALSIGSNQNYYAILIAETDYADPSIQDLTNPLSDAKELMNILQSQYTFDPANIDTVFNRNREDVLQAIMLRCSKLKDNDNLLIFYAGHGTAEKDRFGDVDGYWIPVSAKKGVTGSYISANDINTALRRSMAKHILLIADACFSGAFTRALPADADVNIQKQYSVPSRKIMASGNLEPVPDNSRFIFYLKKALLENTDKYVSANDLFQRFRNAMLNNSDTFPQYAAIKNVGDEGGEFVFIKK